MPLTEEQLAAIDLLLNGVTPTEPEDPAARGAQHMLSDLNWKRDDLTALLRLHGEMPNLIASAVLADIKAGFRDVTQELAALLT